MTNHPVSIRRADLCLVEARAVPSLSTRLSTFQSAVRISVWLKMDYEAGKIDPRGRFNPPCGSLFG